MSSPEQVARTWRSARQSAVRRYGAGPQADRIAVQAVKRFWKWLAKHPRVGARPATTALPPDSR
jgi:hypothetical protein